jgi:Protein of unknown function (DUF2934)
MSKRTTASKPASETAPTTRRRAAKAAEAVTPAAPKAPRTRRKASQSEAAVEAADLVAAPSSERPSHDQIATRAYFIALERGFSNDPLGDWLRAERELMTA